MVTLTALWLPILLSAVAVFIASALAWMVMPHHKGDFKPLPPGAEDALMAAIRNLNLSPGQYGFPDCHDHARMKDPAFQAKMKAGPTGMLNVWPPDAMSKMGRNMAASFIIYLIVSIFVAYLGSQTLSAGADYLKVFQVTGTAAIMAYCFASIPGAIWFNQPGRAIVACLVDGIVYGLLTAGFFGWLWPKAATIITAG